MSINMDTSAGGESDYSDFEYQQTKTSLRLEADQDVDTNPRATRIYEFEPLGQIGGLDNNEVAELVYQEVLVSLEIDLEEGNQNFASSFEARGGFGINLTTISDNQVLPGSFGEPTDLNVIEVEETDSAIVDENAGTLNRDRLLQMFDTNGSVAFDSDGITDANGGGAGYTPTHQYEKNWRQLVGRGPVLDNTDNLSHQISMNADDIVGPVQATMRSHLVWDVAETSDAGRRFSVPDSM